MTDSLTLATFLGDVTDSNIAASVTATIDQLTFDPSLQDYRQRLRSQRTSEGYWDLACALNYLGRRLRPASYLEIGVRRGKSLAQVITGQPSCNVVAIDLWVSPYRGVVNPGPDFVRQEMRRLGHVGELQLLSGESQRVLPTFAADHPHRRFDLITVDGDHTDEGAWSDLSATVELLEPGGWLLFDDLTHPLHTLMPVWERFEKEYAGIIDCAQNVRDHTGTAVARRKK